MQISNVYNLIWVYGSKCILQSR